MTGFSRIGFLTMTDQMIAYEKFGANWMNLELGKDWARKRAEANAKADPWRLFKLMNHIECKDGSDLLIVHPPT